MRKYLLIFLTVFCLKLAAYAQAKPYQIITSDIDNFWSAYDSLAFAHSTQDSINIIQRDYIDKGSQGLAEFLKVRPNTAKSYIKAIAYIPKFWKSLRPRTEMVKTLKPEIEKIYSTYTKYLPDFNPPNVCFAIGALNTGGTTTKHWILIGTEIAAADSLVDTTELTGWLKKILGKGNAMNIVAVVAHETVHTQQAEPKKETLLSQTIKEGSADLIPILLLDLHNDKGIFEYGKKHECTLWKEYKNDLKNDAPASSWFYQGNSAKDKPADLGYFIGAEICRSYYDRNPNKKEALKEILKNTDYKMLLKNSHYNGRCSR